LRISQSDIALKKLRSAAGCYFAVALVVSACSSGNLPDAGHAGSPDFVKQDATDGSATKEKPREEMCKIPELVLLRQERNVGPISDLPVGPGDVIDVSVPEIEELQNQKVRISSQGTISLPLIGTVKVAGLSENELRDVLDQRLATYMKRPRVELFVENYRSRGVAVMGAVQKPGYYDMADERDSIMDMIGLAGGLSPNAAQKVMYSPAGAGRSPSRQSSAGNSEVKVVSARAADGADPARDLPSGGGQLLKTSLTSTPPHSIVLNLDLANEESCLGLPARPGDVVVVPVAGQVMVQGWVRNAGAFPVTPGLTLLGAVSASGGAIFSWNAELLRGDARGDKTIAEYSLSKLESGEQHDPSVQSGDVILVEKSVAGAIPFALYSLFQKFGTGLAFPIP